MLEEAISGMIDQDLEMDEIKKCADAFMNGDMAAMNKLAHQFNQVADDKTVDVVLVALAHTLASVIASVTQAEPDKGATMLRATHMIADDMRRATIQLNREKKDA